MKMKACLRAAAQLMAVISLFFLFPGLQEQSMAQSQPVVSVYFPNWNVYTQDDCQVQYLPWDRVDRIYHAFWKIIEQDERFIIVSTDPWADTDPANPKGHFAQYTRFKAQFPETEVLLSIGGWTYSGLFSKMSLTAESRAGFIQSCIETIRAYPFLDGIDLDWEYPGIHRRATKTDEGSPMVGDDWTNYTALLREMRAALDEAFGQGIKRLTVCAPAAPSNLRKQDYPSLHPYVDAINLMTYDLSSSTKRTAHHSPLYGSNSAHTAVQFLLTVGVPAEKICIGTPLYNHGWKQVSLDGALIGASASGANYGGDMLWETLSRFEEEAAPAGVPGWHMGYDEAAHGAYLWNDDPQSPYYRNLLTYESARSLDAKLEYICAQQLGGIFVWQAGGDDAGADWPMITRMHQKLHP